MLLYARIRPNDGAKRLIREQQKRVFVVASSGRKGEREQESGDESYPVDTSRGRIQRALLPEEMSRHKVSYNVPSTYHLKKLGIPRVNELNEFSFDAFISFSVNQYSYIYTHCCR